MTDECKRHTKYDGSYWEKDARGIPLARVCSKCRKEALSKFNPDVLRNPNYQTDERIDPEY